MAKIPAIPILTGFPAYAPPVTAETLATGGGRGVLRATLTSSVIEDPVPILRISSRGIFRRAGTA